MCMNGNLIKIENLSARFTGSEKDTLNGISFSVRRGEMLALVGESGSGKTLLCKTILGLQPKNVHVSGIRDLGGTRCSLVLQDPMTSLDPAMPVGKQILEAIPHKSRRTKARVCELLTLVGISAPMRSMNDFPAHFSGGMRQRVAIAIALAMEPEVLFADEPTTSLDAGLAESIMELFLRIKNDLETTIVFVTHDLSLVHQYAERILIIEKGSVIEEGTPFEIFENPKSEYTRRLIYYSTFSEHTHSAYSQFPSIPLITAKNLSKNYKIGRGRINRVLQNLDFDIYSGETLGISGRSGIGKSTLLRVLSRIEKPSSGEVVYSNVLRRKQSVQIIFQDSRSALNPRMRIRDILAEPLYIQTGKKPDREELAALLARVELSDTLLDRYPHEVSGGERQRVAIARAISSSPTLILADEPVSSLDVTVRSKIVHLLRRLKDEEKLTLMLISHDTSLLEHVSDRIIKLDESHKS